MHSRAAFLHSNIISRHHFLIVKQSSLSFHSKTLTSFRSPIQASPQAAIRNLRAHERPFSTTLFTSTFTPAAQQLKMSQTSDVFDAAAAGDLDTIKGLGRIHLDAKNDRGWTPLMFAARYGHANVVEYLLSEAKVNPNVISKDGKTAAELAEFWGSTEAVAVFDRLAPNKKKVQTVVAPFTTKSENSTVAAPAGTTASKKAGMADWWKRRTILENLPIQFSGATHNRSGFLRTDYEYLEESLKAPTTRFIILADHGVLFKSTTKDLAFAGYDDIKHLIGDDPIKNLPLGLVLSFLGVDESGNNQPQTSEEVLVKGRRGVGYWALDISAKGQKVTKELKTSTEEFLNTFPDKHGHYMAEMRPAAFKLSFPESGLLAQARSVTDWNKRNQFCPACGTQTISLEGGHKRSCPPTIEKDGQETPSECLAHKGTQNFTYPRTDPVAIVCIISPDGERVLLGRSAGWPTGSYSCIAGFVEPGESLEEAARREAKEETGIRLGHVMYYASQPWPFPNSLMIGCLAEALNEDINITQEDNELEDARWFTRPQVLEALKSMSGFWGKPTDDKSVLRLSPPSAIAHHLLRTWATQEGEVPQSRM